MPPPGRRDPFPGFDFVVEIDGVATAGFQEVSGLEGSIDVVEYREGADVALTARKLPGLVRFGNVTLRRGITDSRDLYAWWDAVAKGKAKSIGKAQAQKAARARGLSPEARAALEEFSLDAERTRLWKLAVAAYPPYADYQAKTTRKIPVFVAEPK